MRILPRTYLGDPILRERARPVPPADLKTKKFRALLGDMFRTMHMASGVGLAAPQIGISAALAVIEVKSPGRRETKVWPKTVVINPKIISKSRESVDDWEGCLSAPSLKGIVPRHKKIRVQYYNEYGMRKTKELSGYIARIFQHEIDHLNGLIYIDRMKTMRSLAFTENPFKKK